ncbi:MAG TPA: hypothetical protein EYP98_20100 [Planctomycetes bacterium]|nr:hypothetical protein [Planctomycetota bacterium]
MLVETRRRLADEHQLELKLVGVLNSTKVLLSAEGLNPAEVVRCLPTAAQRPSDDELLTSLKNWRFTDVIFVDVTAAPMGEFHHKALQCGFHVVTANKRPLSESLAQYEALVSAARQAGVQYGYETTFGAGLPVLHALKELIQTGDQLMTVRGCFSGTLGFICTRLEEGVPLAGAVAEAHSKGLTEPDPREDLSGRDVARKALIIARSAGMALEADDVRTDPLVPGLEEGLEPALKAFEPLLSDKLASAKAKGQVLRYVAEVSGTSVQVGLKAVAADSPLGTLSGPDNMLVFQTRRYNEYPLVIRGPGAGAEVTAAGVLGDVLKIALR